MIVKRVEPMSLAKVSGMLYALMGFFFGACITLVATVGGAMFPGEQGGGLMGMMFGAAAIVILPIFYGVLGFIFSLIGAALYNLVAGWVGGISLDLQ